MCTCSLAGRNIKTFGIELEQGFVTSNIHIAESRNFSMLGIIMVILSLRHAMPGEAGNKPCVKFQRESRYIGT